MMMRYYFKRAYEGDDARFNELISCGCFTFKFVSTLLMLVPSEQLMDFNTQFMGVDHVSQVKTYLKWSQTRLQALYSLRNLNTTDQGSSSQHTPSGGANQANISKGEMKKLRHQIRQDILSEQKLPVMFAGTSSTQGAASSSRSGQHRASGGHLNTSQSNYVPKPGSIEMDPKFLNEKTLGVFALIHSGKPPKNIPILKDTKNQVPEQLNFANCESLITNNDIQGSQLRQALIFCMQHRQGCLVCLLVLNKAGLKYKIFHHLRATHDRHSLYLSNGSMRCPNLMRMPRTSRITVLDQIPQLCKGCLRRTKGVCYNCTQGPPQNRRACESSNKHQLICPCNECVKKTDRAIAQYEVVMADGSNTISNLKINSSQITGLCVNLTNMSPDNLRDMPCNDSPMFEELKR